MKIPKAAVNEFREIYQRKLGKTLKFDSAEIEATNFLCITALLIDGPAHENHTPLINIKTKNERT